MITLTNHHPFRLDDEDKFIDEYDSKSGTLNRYFQTVRYMDEAVKQFIQKLKDEGLYDNSIIVMYGDHYGISENHNEA
ncbi:sulfatase-like hydrolase/transferase, partial [Staphylococcus epidermidis]